MLWASPGYAELRRGDLDVRRRTSAQSTPNSDKQFYVTGLMPQARLERLFHDFPDFQIAPGLETGEKHSTRRKQRAERDTRTGMQRGVGILRRNRARQPCLRGCGRTYAAIRVTAAPLLSVVNHAVQL